VWMRLSLLHRVYDVECPSAPRPSSATAAGNARSCSTTIILFRPMNSFLLAFGVDALGSEARHRKQRQDPKVTVIFMDNRIRGVRGQPNVIPMRHRIFLAVSHAQRKRNPTRYRRLNLLSVHVKRFAQFSEDSKCRLAHVAEAGETAHRSPASDARVGTVTRSRDPVQPVR
jgi:hypothetical protein